jgi:hypothetical protein
MKLSDELREELRKHLRRAVRKRWARATDDQKKAAASNAVSAFWAKLTPEQRSKEMKRRAAVRAKARESKKDHR